MSPISAISFLINDNGLMASRGSRLIHRKFNIVSYSKTTAGYGTRRLYQLKNKHLSHTNYMVDFVLFISYCNFRYAWQCLEITRNLGVIYEPPDESGTEQHLFEIKELLLERGM